MNRIYRLVWNRRAGALVAVAETTRGRGKSGGKAATVASAVASALLALAGDAAVAASTCGSPGSTTITGSETACVMVTGETVTVSGTGTVTGSAPAAISAISVTTGAVSGISINNAGTLNIATGSGILVSQSTVAGAITNSGSISASSTGIRVTATSSVGGGITNSGIIGPVQGGITVDNAASVSSGIHNSGQISANNNGILVSGANVSGGITNSGTVDITVSGSSMAGIRITTSAQVSGGITNAGTIHIEGSGYSLAGINVLTSSQVSGGITNSGLIDVVGSGQGYGINLGNSHLDGSIVNEGTIRAQMPNGSSAFGIRLSSSTMTGGITNNGLIRGGGTSTSTGYGIALFGSSIGGSILNSGTVQGLGTNAGYGIYLNSSTVGGGITNSGTIQGNEAGIALSGSLMTQGITNSGLIQGYAAIKVESSSIGGAISNSGTISATNSGTAIYMDGASTLTGGVVNSGLITSTGYGLYMGGQIGQIVNSTGGRILASYTAIRLFSASVSGGISNSGTISGSNGVVVASGSTVSGGITNSGTISGSSRGVAVGQSSSVSGGISNSGIISGGIAAIWLDQSTVSGGITNSGTLTADRWGIQLQAASVVSGDIVNSGLIQTDTNAAINVVQTSTIAGSITNSGTLHGATGIWMGPSAVVTGRIQNTGTIVGTRTGIAIYSGSTVSGGITNSGTVSGGNAIVVSSSSTVSGGITNSGLVSANVSNGILIQRSSVVSGGITNSGTIHVEATNYSIAGINIRSSSTITGGITNSGLIDVVTTSEWAYGINLSNSLMDGSITNSGTIRAQAFDTLSAYGIRLSGSSMTGGITNSGLIEGSGVDTTTGYGIAMFGSTIDGAIVNSGTVRGVGSDAGYGIYLNSATVGNGITNSGLIQGLNVGIQLSNSSLVSQGIRNLAGGTISGGDTGIKLSNSMVSGGITNHGTIHGGTFAINDTGVGATLPSITIGGNDTAKFIGDVKAANADVVVSGGATFGNTNAFDVQSFTVDNGALFNFGAGPTVSGGLATSGVKVSNGFTNNGTVAVAAGVTAHVTGAYTQAAGATFRTTLADTTSNYGKLAVTGNVGLTNGTTVDVLLSGSPTITNGTTVQGVITSGGTLTATPAQISVTDNNLFYDFAASTARNPNELDLVVATDQSVFTDAAAASGSPSLKGVAGALQTMLNTGIPTAFEPVFARLGTMTQEELNVAMAQMLPPLIGAAPQAGINALHSMNKIIQSRIESNQGLSSGEAGADKYMWMRVFGNSGDQDNHDGVTGFESKTAGLVIGGDAPVTDRIRAGVAFTYAKSDIDGNSSSAPSSVDVDTYELVGYGSYNLDPYTDINVQLDLGQNKADSKRRIGFMGTKAEANFDSLAWHASVGIGRLFPLSEKTNVTPSLRLDYTHMRTEDYTESGAGPLNLKVDSDTYEELLLSTDVKGTHQLNDQLKLVGNVSLGYDFASDKTQAASTFTGGGPAFTTTGLDVSPWLYRAGLGLIRDDKKGLEYSVRYDVEGRSSGYFNQTLAARLRWAF